MELVRQAKAQGLPVSCDISINSLHLTDLDVGYFDSRTRLNPPLRQQADRAALRAALADGTVDALVSDHTPVGADEKDLPFAEAEPGATGMELLWSLALKWGQEEGLDVSAVIARITHQPAQVLGASLGDLQGSVGQLAVGGVADLCVLTPDGHWPVTESALRSQGKSTPFSGYELPGRVLATLVAGHVAFEV